MMTTFRPGSSSTSAVESTTESQSAVPPTTPSGGKGFEGRSEQPAKSWVTTGSEAKVTTAQRSCPDSWPENCRAASARRCRRSWVTLWLMSITKSTETGRSSSWHQPDVPADAPVEEDEIPRREVRHRAVPPGDDDVHQDLFHRDAETDLPGRGGGQDRHEQRGGEERAHQGLTACGETHVSAEVGEAQFSRWGSVRRGA